MKRIWMIRVVNVLPVALIRTFPAELLGDLASVS